MAQLTSHMSKGKRIGWGVMSAKQLDHFIVEARWLLTITELSIIAGSAA